jgi:hypothetical protein
MKFQICRKCGEELELSEDNFHRDKSSKTGFVNICKSCVNEKHRSSYVSRWMQTLPQEFENTSFDDACERNRLDRHKVKRISLYQEAF